MKIAILADIHSNADALQAVLEDARKHGVDAYAVAGDIVSDGPCTRESVELVRSLNCFVVKGNREDYMLKYRAGQFKGWDGSKQFSSLLWTYQSLAAADLDWIAALPEQAVMPLEGKLALRIVHGSPFSMYELLRPDKDMGPVERAAAAVPERALAFGHNHMQWSGPARGKLLMDPGSVGVHFNKEASAEYGILTVNHGELSARLLRVPYDFAAFERRLETSGLMETSPVWTKVTFEGVKAGKNHILAFLNDARRAMEERGLPSGPIPNDIWDEVAGRWWKEKGWGSLD